MSAVVSSIYVGQNERAKPQAAGAARAHIPQLDGLRGLAILGVMIVHFQGAQSPVGGIARVMWLLGNLGGTGVDLFFVLSGFLITGILLDTKESPHFFRNFYMRRVLRIFPLYYGVLLAAFVILPRWTVLNAPSTNQLWLWLYSSNIGISLFGKQFSIFTHFWSLAIEEQFYLIWPMLVFLLSQKSLMRLCIAIFVGAALTRAIFVVAGSDPFYFTFCRTDALAIGAYLAIAVRSAEGLLDLAADAWILAGILLLIFVPLYLLKSGGGDVAIQILKFSLYAIVYGALLLAAITSPGNSIISVALSGKPLMAMGKYSYGMYVYHMICLLLVQRFMPSLGRFTDTAMAMAITFVVAWLSWHLFEKQFLNLKRFFA
ncbi:MAG TPA: acyltransferase [Tepidisphaeraceae bacterium]|nr:acyltransferase [Tepidisphaeraceae bacterium]